MKNHSIFITLAYKIYQNKYLGYQMLNLDIQIYSKNNLII